MPGGGCALLRLTKMTISISRKKPTGLLILPDSFEERNYIFQKKLKTQWEIPKEN